MKSTWVKRLRRRVNAQSFIGFDNYFYWDLYPCGDFAKPLL